MSHHCQGLGPALHVAVPLWIAEFEQMSPEVLAQVRKPLSYGGDSIFYLGDVLQFKTTGQTAHAFTQLAKTLAMAHVTQPAFDWNEQVLKLERSAALMDPEETWTRPA